MPRLSPYERQVVDVLFSAQHGNDDPPWTVGCLTRLGGPPVANNMRIGRVRSLWSLLDQGLIEEVAHRCPDGRAVRIIALTERGEDVAKGF